MENNLIMENEFTKSETLAVGTRRYCRWDEREREIIENALADDNIQTVAEFIELVSSLTGRTPMAVYSRAYYYHMDSYNKKFNKDLTGKSRSEAEEALKSEQMVFSVLTKEELELIDSRTIFELYEKLNEFNTKLNALQEENATLRQYHNSSEKEFARLNKELADTKDQRNRAVAHIKGIQSLIINLSQSAFGNEATTKKQEFMQKAAI